MAVQERLYTADEFFQMDFGDSGKLYELVKGAIEEVPLSGGRATFTGGRIYVRIYTFVEVNQLGHVTTAEGGYILAHDPYTVRAPDIGFISKSKLSDEPVGFIPAAPDLAIEVLSPNDRTKNVLKKVREFLLAGTRLVWVVDPDDQTVEVYRLASGESMNVQLLESDSILDGEDVLPGFKLAIDEIFAK